MKKVFISYRRSDFYQAKSLAEYLQIEFGYDNIFLDRKKIMAGANWPSALKNEVARADIMIVIIGPDWLYMQDPLSGKRRIDLKNDWVRQEITTFMNRMKTNRDLILLPLLIKSAKLPAAEHLDSGLSRICKFQFIQFNESTENTDYIEIITALRKHGMKSLSLPLISTPTGPISPKKLSRQREHNFLKKFPEWKIIMSDKFDVNGENIRELYRHFEFDNFDDAWKFMSKVKDHIITSLNHHPKWQNNYGRVEIWLSTANIGHNLTKRDIDFAEQTETVAKEYFKILSGHHSK